MKSIYLRFVSGGIVLSVAFGLLIGIFDKIAAFANSLLLNPVISKASAIVMLCIGVALVIYRKDKKKRWLGRTALLASFFAVVIGAGLAGYAAFVPENPLIRGSIGSMVPLLCWALLGLSLVLAGLRQRLLVGLSFLSSSIALIIPWTLLFSYLSLVVSELAGHEAPIFVMSPVEALAMLLASFGAMSLIPERILLTAISFGSRGATKWVLLLVFLSMPLMSSWLLIYIHDNQFIDAAEIFAVHWGVVSFLMVFMIVLPGLVFFAKDREKDRLVDGLRKAERKFRGLLESAPDAMVIVNPRGEIIFVNTQTEKLFGYTKEELIGREVEVLMPARFFDVHRHHRDKYFDYPKVRMMGEGLELSGRHKSGLEFPVEISLSPIETEEGLLVSAAIRDITETKKTQNQIRELNHTLEQKVAQRTRELEQIRDSLEDEVEKRTGELQLSMKELEAFSYSVSHDLRAPLRAVAGYGNILREDYYEKLDEDGKRTLDIIIKNTNRMGQLIDDILAFSRYNRTEMKRYRLDIGAMFTEVYQQLKNIEPTEREVEYIVDPLPEVQGDREMINQVIVNLVSNALKYTRPRKMASIRVGSAREGKETVFFVKDNGVGFDERYISKLFGVFQRLHKDTEFEGTGVGLAIVQRIVHRHGGKVWAEGKLNEGATFYFTLPGVEKGKQ